MRTAAVIAELNPFHRGHAHLIREARRMGADRVLVLMSGDFVQRGEPAIFDRYGRTQMALAGGADLVVSYPARFSTSSAEDFAGYAVMLLDALNTVDDLVFGSESGELSLLLSCAGVLADESADYKEKLRASLKRGLSFPKARAAALPEYAGILSAPNDILAIEYLKALLRSGSRMKPHAVKRIGAGHNEGTPGTDASSQALRREILSGNTRIGDFLPDEVKDVYSEVLRRQGAMSASYFAELTAAALWAASSPEDLRIYADVTDDLSGTLFAHRCDFSGFESFASLCASRSLTESHVRRALLHMALGIRKTAAHGLFCHVLGWRRDAEDILLSVRKNSRIPVVVNPAADVPSLDAPAHTLFDEEVRLHGLYGAVRKIRLGTSYAHLYANPIIKV